MTARLVLTSLAIGFAALSPLFASDTTSLPKTVVTGKESPGELQRLHRTCKDRFYAYPNGWGSSPEAARKDLERVLRIYSKRPGYQVHDYVRIVPIARGVYQADGCVSFLAPRAITESGRSSSPISKQR